MLKRTIRHELVSKATINKTTVFFVMSSFSMQGSYHSCSRAMLKSREESRYEAGPVTNVLEVENQERVKGGMIKFGKYLPSYVQES